MPSRQQLRHSQRVSRGLRSSENISGKTAKVCSFVAENLPQIHVVDADATYLMWLDCSALTDDSVAFTQMIREKTGLYLSEGAGVWRQWTLLCEIEYRMP